MPKCTIDGKEIEFEPGQNLIEVAKQGGIDIPFFCYHPELTVVAQCRMCAVEVEGMNKLQTGCSTEAREGMVVRTKSEPVKKAQESTMEFLLINHPLDCPVCDEAGECDLQDTSFGYGSNFSRYTEERRTYVDIDMGDVIQKNMNRCIHCTRCIRFGDEVAGIREMVAVQRGNNTDISTIDGKPLETEYAGNYADICPTGSLTLKNFRFRKRSWMLKKTPSVCEGCSRGCNIELHEDKGIVYRTVPRVNPEVNRHWICDEGRFLFEYVNAEERIGTPRVGSEATGWTEALSEARKNISGQKVAVLLGSDHTLEEGSAVVEFAGQSLDKASVQHFGTPGVLSSSDDADADQILKRKSKTANLHGMEKLGLKGTDQAPDADVVLLVRGGRAALPSLSGKKVIGIGVFTEEEAKDFVVTLPSLSFAEKTGTIVNCNGVEQKLKRSIRPVGESKALSEILMLWTNSGAAGVA